MNTVANDEQWQQHSDDWVKMTHESRLRKEKEFAQREIEGQSKKPEQPKNEKK